MLYFINISVKWELTFWDYQYDNLTAILHESIQSGPTKKNSTARCLLLQEKLYHATSSAGIGIF